MNYIAYASGLYLCQGTYGNLLKSSNGTSWSNVSAVNNTSGNAACISQMCYNSNTSTWLVVCGSSGFYKSTDGGSTWVSVNVGATATDPQGYGCTYNTTLNLYCISGVSTGTRTSSDLTTWNTVTTIFTEARTRLFSVGSYIIKCSVSNVEYTSNGSTWVSLGVTNNTADKGSVVSIVPSVKWRNATLSGSMNLAGLSDVSISNLANGDTLIWNAVNSKYNN